MATEYTHIAFPSWQMASGRWIKIHMFRKFGSTDDQQLAGLFAGSPATMEEHPWALGGLPECIEDAPAGAGFIGIDGCEFKFHNIPVKPSVDDTTLFDIYSFGDPSRYLWFIRVWISPGTTDTYATAANWTAWIDMAQVDGDLHQEDKTWNTYTMSARNLLACLELVSIPTWIGSYCLHATYDKTPTSMTTRGTAVLQLRFGNADGTSAMWWALPWAFGIVSTDPLLTPKLFRLTDVIWSMADALGIAKPINLSATGGAAGKVAMSWVFSSGNAASPTVWTDYDFDDLHVVASMYHSNGTMDVHDQKYGLFDNENLSKPSAYNVANALEFLKVILAPFGLIAGVQHDPADGGLYLAIREQDLISTVLEDEQEVLSGIKLEAGDRAQFGMRVIDPDGTEYFDGDVDGETLGQPLICPDRMRYGARWRHTAGWTDDIRAFCLGMWATDTDASSTVFREISRITPKKDGTTRTTASVNSMYTPPHVTHEADSLDPDDHAGRVTEAGSIPSRATLAYYFNGGADPDTDAVGVYRRVMKKLTWRVTGLKTTAVVGALRTILGQNWTIRRKRISPSMDETEFEAERGTYDL